MNNEIPAVVFQGTDICAVEILKAAQDIYRKHGCSEEFLFDWQMLIEDVIAFQKECADMVKLPKLSSVEAELIRKDMYDKLNCSSVESNFSNIFQERDKL